MAEPKTGRAALRRYANGNVSPNLTDKGSLGGVIPTVAPGAGMTYNDNVGGAGFEDAMPLPDQKRSST
jgi:hypothetical protein